MDWLQKQYYYDMVGRGRGTIILKDGHLVSIVTYFVGDDDEKFLLFHKPWTVVEDDPNGTTLYIDQMITYKGRSTSAFIHKEFTKLLSQLKGQFKNIKKVKWVRVGAQFRKHDKIEGVINGKKIHVKNLTF